MQAWPRRVGKVLLLVLAVFGLSVGAAVEIQHRRARDHAAAVEQQNRALASWYRAQVAICSDSIARGRPYPARDRQAILQAAAGSLGVPVDEIDLTDWSTELPHHRDRLNQRTLAADQAALRKDSYQRWLFWPH